MEKEHRAIEQAVRGYGRSTSAEGSIAALEVDGSVSVLKKINCLPVCSQHHHIRLGRKNKNRLSIDKQIILIQYYAQRK
jgi:uncharacterized membrane protein YcaP (DUF421 family)